MKKFICAVLAICALCLPLNACKKQTDEKTVIRLNEVTHSIFYAPLYIAMENGFFDAEGIKIELTNGGGADKSMTAILSGGADIGLMGVEAATYVYLEGKKDYPRVFGQLTKRDGSFLVSRKAEPDFKWENLKGSEDVTLNNDVAFNLMGPSFDGGTGDYTTLFEPTASEYQAAGKGYIVASVGKESGEIPYTAFMALESYINKNKTVVEKFLRAMQKAIKYLGETDEKIIAESLLKQFPDTSLNSVSVALKSYKEIDAWVTEMAMTEKAFNNLQDVMQNAGELTQRVEHGKIAYNEIAEKVYKEVYAKT